MSIWWTPLLIINSRAVKGRLDEDDVSLIDTIDNLGRTQQVTFVTESGLYDVIIRSDSEQAKPFRTAGTAENPLFCLSDVCKVLDLQTSKVKTRLNERGVYSIPTPTYNQYGALVEQEMTYVNEQNLYKVIMRSDKPQAEPFQDWVCGEVLPSIRKTGSYSITQLSRKELALMVIQAEEENERLALENKHQREVIATKQTPRPPRWVPVRPHSVPAEIFYFFPVTPKSKIMLNFRPLRLELTMLYGTLQRQIKNLE